MGRMKVLDVKHTDGTNPRRHVPMYPLGDDGRVKIERCNEPRLQRQRLLLIGRL